MQTNVEVSNLVNPFLDFLRRGSNEVKHLLKIGIRNYLEDQTSKYLYTNTFLHRSEKVRFDSIYYPIVAKYRYTKTGFQDLVEVFGKQSYIAIIGNAGSGKSTLTRYIFLNAIKQSYKIPILIELRHLNSYEGSLARLVQDKILGHQIKPSLETLDRALKKGNFLIILDGYDEIFSENKQKIDREFEGFIDRYSTNKFVVTSRHGGGIEGIPRFHHFEVQDLSREDISKFINLVVNNEERRVQINRTIADSRSASYQHYLRNPLLLSMFILAFKSHPEIPRKKSAFYRNVFDTLYSKHDGITKGSFPRQKLTNLQREDFEDLLNSFSYVTLVQGKYSFTDEHLSKVWLQIKKKFPEFTFSLDNLLFDLRTSISILIKEGFEYKFPHRSMQEYFAANFLSRLPGHKKGQGYGKLNSALLSSTYSSGFNLWDLCKELDEFGYLSHILVPTLEGALDGMKVDSDAELAESFFREFDFGYHIAGKLSNEGLNLHAHFAHNLLNRILEFEGIFDLSIILGFFSEDEIRLKVRDFLMGEGNLLIVDAAQWVPGEFYSKKLMELLINEKVIKDIKDCKEEIEKKLFKAMVKIKQRELDLDDFLNF